MENNNSTPAEKQPYQLAEDKISLFINPDCTPENKQPKFRGEINQGGVIREVSVWVTESKAGTKYLKGNVQDKYEGKPSATDADFAL